MTCGSVICYIGDRIGCWTRKDPEPVQGEGLENAFEIIGSLRPWMWMIFFLCALPGILNIWALISNTFQAPEIPYWCYIPELQNTNWTQEQKRIITTGGKKSSCKYKKHDYEKLSTMSFEEAEQTTKESEVDSTTCKKFSFENPETSITAEWDMVCSRTVFKSILLVAVSFGKFLGAFVFGPIADRYGRKRSIFISCMFYIFVGPIGLIRNYYSFLVMRICLGIAGAGLYNCCFTLLMETCQKKHRTLLGILYNQSYSVGLLVLPGISLAFPKWIHLQVALFCIPPLILVLICWFVPESPRWLKTKGRRSDAWKVVKRCDKTLVEHLTPASDTQEENAVEEEKRLTFHDKFESFLTLLNHSELRLRLLITCFVWFTLALVYYAISLNSDNFEVDRYIYIAICGVLETVSYIIPIPILHFIGRRTLSAICLFIGAVGLFIVLLIPKDISAAIMGCALLARLAIGSVYSVFVLYTAELFPTINRNTAVGISSTMSQVGALSAPFVVDLLGQIEWFIPSTICAALSLVAFFMVTLLPETKGMELSNTIEEVNEAENTVSFKNCFRCGK